MHIIGMRVCYRGSYDVGIHIADMEQYMEIILVGKPQPAPQ